MRWRQGGGKSGDYEVLILLRILTLTEAHRAWHLLERLHIVVKGFGHMSVSVRVGWWPWFWSGTAHQQVGRLAACLAQKTKTVLLPFPKPSPHRLTPPRPPHAQPTPRPCGDASARPVVPEWAGAAAAWPGPKCLQTEASPIMPSCPCLLLGFCLACLHH